MAYFPICPESEHETFREDELESEGDNETDLAVSQDPSCISWAKITQQSLSQKH